MKSDTVICFPADLLMRLKYPDEAFVDEANFFREAGFEIATIDIENKHMFYDGTSKASEQDLTGKTVLYRGWMLTPEEYGVMESMIAKRHGTMYTSCVTYHQAHHLPNWIDTFKQETAESVVYPLPVSPETIFENTPAWGSYFIKDYVKSYYGHRKAHSAEELRDICRYLMENENIQQGIVVRKESVSLFHGTQEVRCWWTPKGWLTAHHPQHVIEQPEIVIPSEYLDYLETGLQSLGVGFVSVDLYWDIELNQWKLIEIGDGQVSGLGNISDLAKIVDLL